jgi:hypothetical protein
MLKQKQKEKKPPQLAMWGMVAAGTAVVLILLYCNLNFPNNYIVCPKRGLRFGS